MESNITKSEKQKSLIVIPVSVSPPYHTYNSIVPPDKQPDLRNANYEKFDYDGLTKAIEKLKPKKIIVGIMNEPLSKHSTHPYFMAMVINICKKTKTKLVVVTEQHPKSIFVNSIDEIVFSIGCLSQYYKDSFVSLNFMPNVRVSVKNVSNETMDSFKEFRGRITIFQKPKGEGDLPPNVRLTSPKSEDYLVYLPNGEVIPAFKN